MFGIKNLQRYVLLKQLLFLPSTSANFMLLQINKKLLKDATWNDSLERLAWRVDVRAMSKASAEQNDEPVAFFELATKKHATQANGKNSAVRNAKFEMNREEVGSMLATLNEIDLIFEGVR